MPAGTASSPFDDVVVVRLRVSRYALLGGLMLLMFALFLGALAFAPDDDGHRTPWFSAALLLIPAVLSLLGALLTWRGSSGRVVVGRDGVRIVSPGHGVIELGRDAILAVDEPPRPGRSALRLGHRRRRHATLSLTLAAPIAVLMPGEDQRLVSTREERFDVLVLACRDAERVRRALRTPPFRPLPKPPPAALVRSVHALRTILVAGMGPIVGFGATAIIVAFGALVLGDDPGASAGTGDPAAQTGPPPALPGFKGTFLRGTAPGGARVYVWHVGSRISVRVDSPALDCGIASTDWDAQTSPDLPLGADGRFRGRWSGHEPASYDETDHTVVSTVDGRLAGDTAQVTFTRTDRATGPASPDACERSGKAIAHRVG